MINSDEKKKKKKREREIGMLNEVWHGERQQALSDAENGEIEYGDIVNDGRNKKEVEAETITHIQQKSTPFSFRLLLLPRQRYFALFSRDFLV